MELLVKEENMSLRNLLLGLAVICLLGGAAFLIQGTRLLPFDNPLYRSYMTGQPLWGWIGAAMIVLSVGLFYFGATMPKRR
jgi:hypothetical protein